MRQWMRSVVVAIRVVHCLAVLNRFSPSALLLPFLRYLDRVGLRLLDIVRRGLLLVRAPDRRWRHLWRCAEESVRLHIARHDFLCLDLLRWRVARLSILAVLLLPPVAHLVLVGSLLPCVVSVSSIG